VPTGLTASAVSPTQINLSWNASSDNVGVTGYYVYWNDVPLTQTTGTSFQHTGLTPGTTYNYRVSAYDAVPNHSAWTATPVSVTTPAAVQADTTPPSVPTGFTVTMVASTQINLSWSPSADNVGVAGYIVYWNDVPLANVGNQTTFQHTGLTPGATYNYRVSAYDGVPNHSAWTNVVSATTPLIMTVQDTIPPSVPTNLTAASITTNSIKLTWKASADNVSVAGYILYVNDVPVANVGNATTFTHIGLSPNTTYNYRVSAYDAVPNHSAWTAPLAVKTKKH
jgi:chitodextrinase